MPCFSSAQEERLTSSADTEIKLSDLPDYPEVMPKRADEARGINFCGADNYYDIIPADVGVYMRSTNFIEGNNIMINSLTQACQ